MLGWLPGRPLTAARPLSPATLTAIGRLQGRLCHALRGFFHPAARQFMPWDLTNGLLLAPETRRAMPPEAARLAAAALDRLARLLPRLAELRAQVIHHDAHLGNLLGDPERPGTVTGVIDFGDLVHAPLVLELATSLAGIAEDRVDFPQAAAAVVAGFHAIVPLEEDELALLFDLTLGRSILTVQLTAVKAAAPGAPSSLLDAELPVYVEALRRLAALDPAEVTQSLRAACGLAAPRSAATPETAPVTPSDTPALIRRREAALGPGAMHFYRQPLHIVRGRDVWLTDADGRDYLDCYNNVPSVGHCHPHVVEAIARQAATLNTHTRYLHEAVVEYAERLAATLPGDLSVCLFACTGSEANDLALRIAPTVTGNRGAIVTEHAYHGTTIATTHLSTIEYPAAERPDWLATVPPPDLYRGPAGRRPQTRAPPAPASSPTPSRRFAPAATARRCSCTTRSSTRPASTPPRPGYLPAAYAAIRAAGGLIAADEVQSGLCRLGDHVWGFEDSGVVPDIVTIGKPMGNGHPLAAVITTPAIAAAFAKRFGYFNTFAGNPVSAAAGLAVLDVGRARGPARQRRRDRPACSPPASPRWRTATPSSATPAARASSTASSWSATPPPDEPAPDLAARAAELMREAGVLIAASGPHANVLKLRPPLTFRPEHARQVTQALDDALATLA